MLHKKHKVVKADSIKEEGHHKDSNLNAIVPEIVENEEADTIVQLW